MFQLAKKSVLAAAMAATAMVSATPALAQSRHHNDDTRTAVAIGAGILGIIAVAALTSNRDDDYYDNGVRGNYYGNDGYYYGSNGGYYNGGYYDNGGRYYDRQGRYDRRYDRRQHKQDRRSYSHRDGDRDDRGGYSQRSGDRYHDGDRDQEGDRDGNRRGW